MRTLVIAAHPDDEVLGCGGTVAKLARSGTEVFIAILGEGITSRYASRDQADEERLQGLHRCAKTAGSLLGARDVFLANLPDNRFDTVPLLDVVKTIEDVIGKVQPEVVYTQHGGDLNVDHAITHRATLTATRPVEGSPVRAVYAYEVASSTEWAFRQFSPAFRPQVFVDVADTLELKIRAMAEYESESRRFPHPRSAEALRALATHRGSAVGVAAAEAFEVVRELR